MTLFKATGTLKYAKVDNWYKLIAETDQGISDFYRSLVPKYITLRPQKYKTHISIVRKEIPSKLDFWGKYEDKVIDFEYSPIIYNDKVYYWLNVFSKDFESIRDELGLKVESLYTKPPEGYRKCFHMTIGNLKT